LRIDSEIIRFGRAAHQLDSARRDVRPRDSPTKVDTFGRSSITFATVEGRKAPPSPWRVGVAKLETGSAVLTQTGADARIISMVNPDGFEYRS
jgi:hypothetical protein